MDNRLVFAFLALAIPAAADDSRLFHQIREKDTIALVLPKGSCKASVVGRDLNGITVKLKNTTNACGKKKSLVTLSRSDVLDVVQDRHRIDRDPGMSWSARCAVGAATLATVTAGYAIGELTGSNLGMLSVIAASGAAGAFLCRSHAPGYTVFVRQITPTQALPAVKP